jgi:hypothetical protein
MASTLGLLGGAALAKSLPWARDGIVALLGGWLVAFALVFAVQARTAERDAQSDLDENGPEAYRLEPTMGDKWRALPLRNKITSIVGVSAAAVFVLTAILSAAFHKR